MIGTTLRAKEPTHLIMGRIKNFHKFDIHGDMFMCIFNILHHNPTSKKWIK